MNAARIISLQPPERFRGRRFVCGLRDQMEMIGHQAVAHYRKIILPGVLAE
jgi:hypothetical protein